MHDSNFKNSLYLFPSHLEANSFITSRSVFRKGFTIFFIHLLCGTEPTYSSTCSLGNILQQYNYGCLFERYNVLEMHFLNAHNWTFSKLACNYVVNLTFLVLYFAPESAIVNLVVQQNMSSSNFGNGLSQRGHFRPLATLKFCFEDEPFLGLFTFLLCLFRKLSFHFRVSLW